MKKWIDYRKRHLKDNNEYYKFNLVFGQSMAEGYTCK